MQELILSILASLIAAFLWMFVVLPLIRRLRKSKTPDKTQTGARKSIQQSSSEKAASATLDLNPEQYARVAAFDKSPLKRDLEELHLGVVSNVLLRSQDGNEVNHESVYAVIKRKLGPARYFKARIDDTYDYPNEFVLRISEVLEDVYLVITNSEQTLPIRLTIKVHFNGEISMSYKLLEGYSSITDCISAYEFIQALLTGNNLRLYERGDSKPLLSIQLKKQKQKGSTPKELKNFVVAQLQALKDLNSLVDRRVIPSPLVLPNKFGIADFRNVTVIMHLVNGEPLIIEHAGFNATFSTKPFPLPLKQHIWHFGIKGYSLEDYAYSRTLPFFNWKLKLEGLTLHFDKVRIENFFSQFTTALSPLRPETITLQFVPKRNYNVRARYHNFRIDST